MKQNTKECHHSYKHDPASGWYCALCGSPFKRPQLPRTVIISGNDGYFPLTFTGDIRGGELVRWPSGAVDVVCIP